MAFAAFICFALMDQMQEKDLYYFLMVITLVFCFNAKCAGIFWAHMVSDKMNNVAYFLIFRMLDFQH